jgi:methyl-accepting chemotaxis protein
MSIFKVQSIGNRVMLSLAAMLVVLMLTLLMFYANRSKSILVDQEVQSARDVVMVTESVRTNTAKKWELGLFSPALLRKLAADGGANSREAILATVPVVSAWQTAENAAKAGGFEFRTPRRNPRNSKNEPDAVEARALELLAKDRSLAEYWLVDEQRNAVRYFRPVRLSQECLYCHGDPGQSRTLWGREDGKDITGNVIEGKAVGDMHGAFEVIKPLAAADAALRRSLGIAAAIVAAFLAVMLFSMRWITSRMITRPIDGAIVQIQRAQEAHDLTFRLPDAGDDELSRLGRTLNQFLASLQYLIKGVHASVGNVASAAADVKWRSEQTSTSMFEQ